MSPRDRILAALRTALGPRRTDPAAIMAEAAALLSDPDATRPRLSPPDPVEAFAMRTVSKLGGTLDRVSEWPELPDAVHRYLTRHALPQVLAVQPDPVLRKLDWSGLELRDTIRPDEAAVLGRARWGIAETGTLVFHSGPDTAVLGHFLALHHIVALRTADILPHLEDYASVAGPAPRNVNLITGASGTTDIEGSYVRGAHGPEFLHVVLVGATSP